MKLNIRPTSLWSEFRNFAFMGNIVDLAVAVILGINCWWRHVVRQAAASDVPVMSS